MNRRDLFKSLAAVIVLSTGAGQLAIREPKPDIMALMMQRIRDAEDTMRRQIDEHLYSMNDHAADATRYAGMALDPKHVSDSEFNLKSYSVGFSVATP